MMDYVVHWHYWDDECADYLEGEDFPLSIPLGMRPEADMVRQQLAEWIKMSYPEFKAPGTIRYHLRVADIGDDAVEYWKGSIR